MSNSKEILSVIESALNVYCECDCMSSFPGRKDEPRVATSDKAIARGIAHEIREERLFFLHVVDRENSDE